MEVETIKSHVDMSWGKVKLDILYKKNSGVTPSLKNVSFYFGGNLLAKSLNNDCYQNSPQFKRFFEAENLQFKSYASFDKTALLERQELYEELAKKIWGITRLDEQLN
jgi:hypothetical protein